MKRDWTFEDVTRFSRRYRFSDWPNRDVPAVTAGVYAVWDGDELVYCGMAGRDLKRSVEEQRARAGLVGRLASHAGGRLSGNQFCVYVANRLVIPSLRPAQLELFRSGELTLDALTKQHICSRFEYQFACVETSADAFALERKCRDGTVFGVKPLLNPATPATGSSRRLRATTKPSGA